AIARVRDTSGRILFDRAPAAPRRVLSAEHAYLVTDILSDPDARIPGFGGVTPSEVPFPAAVKTGTSTGFRDTWTIGFTPNIAIGVWVGNANGAPMLGLAGVEGAGPIWRDATHPAVRRRERGARCAPHRRAGRRNEDLLCARALVAPGRATRRGGARHRARYVRRRRSRHRRRARLRSLVGMAARARHAHA